MGALLECCLPTPEKVKSHLKPKCAYIEVRFEVVVKKIVLDKVDVCILDGVFVEHKQTLLDEDVVEIGPKDFEIMFEDLRSKVCVKECRVPPSTADVEQSYVLLILVLLKYRG